jgi:hypothetical protein
MYEHESYLGPVLSQFGDVTRWHVHIFVYMYNMSKHRNSTIYALDDTLREICLTGQIAIYRILV